MNKLVDFATAQLAKKHGFDIRTEHVFYTDVEEFISAHEVIDHEISENITFRPTQDELQTWLEARGMYIAIAPELYADGINWNWQILWYEPKEKWEYVNTVDDDDGKPVSYATRISTGTGWYGDNGEYPSRQFAMEAALVLALRKLNIYYRNNSLDKLAALYGTDMNTLLGKIRVFAQELGEWSFRDLNEQQLEIIISKLGEPTIK